MRKTVEPGVRIPAEVYETLKRWAARNERSLNREIVLILKDYVAAFERHDPKG